MTLAEAEAAAEVAEAAAASARERADQLRARSTNRAEAGNNDGVPVAVGRRDAEVPAKPGLLSRVHVVTLVRRMCPAAIVIAIGASIAANFWLDTAALSMICLTWSSTWL
jgi:hypothetical protein